MEDVYTKLTSLSTTCRQFQHDYEPDKNSTKHQNNANSLRPHL
jgi:hypothetical protein